MNLVFFDIECASVFKTTAKICAFGYVLCDEQFNIIEKEDILVNPKGKFHLTDGRGERGLVLPYEYSEFKKYPTFPQVYGGIKKLLEDKGNLVFGHATQNDVNYLDLETRRFNLPPFDFGFSDSQIMYMTSINDFSRQFGLEYITRDLDVEFTPHRAADDAYATMRVVQALCKKHNCSPFEIENLLGIRRGRLKGHKIYRPVSSAFTEYRNQKQREKEARAERRNKFYSKVNCRHKITSTKLKGQTVCFSRVFEDDIQHSIPLVERIFSCGGKYTQKIGECTIYVCDEADDSQRTKAVRDGGKLRIYTPEQLSDLMGK